MHPSYDIIFRRSLFSASSDTSSLETGDDAGRFSDRDEDMTSPSGMYCLCKFLPGV